MVKGLITTKTNKKVRGYDNMNHLYFSISVDCEQVDEIKLSVKSHDQGWGNSSASWTWAEIGILDSEGKEKGARIEVCKNDAAKWECQTHKKTITKNDALSNAFLSNIKKGDKVAIWLRSKFPGWANYAEGGKIELLEKGSKDEKRLLRKVIVKDWADWIKTSEDFNLKSLKKTLKTKLFWHYSNKEDTTEVEFDSDELELSEKGELIIADYPNLEKVVTRGGKLVKNITKVTIKNCPQLKELVITNFTDNQELVIINCPNLEVLECKNNKLSKLVGVNKCLNLIELNCRDNQLNNLDISNCRRLKKLDCNGNKLTNLDLVNLEELEYLNCSDNQLIQLNLSQQAKLEKLYISKNNFLAKNPTWLSHLVSLKELDLTGNNFTSLEFTKTLTALEKLNIFQTPITTGLEYLPQSLKEIKCEGKLKNELVLYNNNLVFWQETHPKLMEEAGKEKISNYYQKLKPEVVTTTPQWLNEELKQKSASAKHELIGLDYSQFALHDGRKFSWEKEENSEIKLADIKKLPLRLYNLKTKQVEEPQDGTDIKNYAILSYVWGDREGSEEISKGAKGQDYEIKLTKLGSKAVNKSTNTLEFLNKRQGANLDHIWIDQFCINQSDPVEKGQEVRNQKKYYNNATVTLISINGRIGERKETDYKFAVHIIKQIVASDWFRRSWTFQEGLLSKQTIFMLDDYLVDGRILAMAWGTLQQNYLSRLNIDPQIFITPLGWSYSIQKGQTVNFTLGQVLLAVKHREQTVPVDGIYSILGLLPYGDKVIPNYKGNLCKNCKKIENEQKKSVICEHDKEQKTEFPTYFKEELEQALLSVMEVVTKEGYQQEIFSWFGSRNNNPHYWYIPQVWENGSTNVEGLTSHQPKNMKLTPQGVRLVGKRYVVEKVPEYRDNIILVTTKQNELSLKGISETIERIKVGDSLVVISEEQERDYQLAILIPSTDDCPIDIVEFKLESGESLVPQELFIDMKNKREIIFGSENILHYHQLTKELTELGSLLEKSEYEQKKQELVSLLEWNKWKKIQQNFNQELVQKWKDNNFTYEQVSKWDNAFKGYFNPQEIDFYLWLRDSKKLTAEECASKQELRKRLITEYGCPNKSKIYGGSGGRTFNDLITIWEVINWKKIDSIWISKIVIRFSDKINNIQFTYQVKSKGKWCKVVGEHGEEWTNTESKSVSLAVGEYLVNVEGWTNGGLVTGLSFQTSNFQTDRINTYGPYGEVNGEKFNLPADNNKYATVFFGRRGFYLDAIGIQQATQEQQLENNIQELQAQIEINTNKSTKIW